MIITDVVPTSATTSTEVLYQGLEWLIHVIHTKKGATQGTGSTENKDEEVDEANDVTEHKSTHGLHADKSWTFIKKLFLMDVG